MTTVLIKLDYSAQIKTTRNSLIQELIIMFKLFVKARKQQTNERFFLNFIYNRTNRVSKIQNLDKLSLNNKKTQKITTRMNILLASFYH